MKDDSPFPWWYPVGAQAAIAAAGAHFRVWAPEHDSLRVHLTDLGSQELKKNGDGYFSGFVPEALNGARYSFFVDAQGPYPDPASRYQPEGPHKPSQIVDPSLFHWTDANWRGLKIEGQIVYELHVGTYTREGTFRAAENDLPYLADIGVTVVELMPIADFPGNFGWGYDGVNLFAPSRLYGMPDDLRRLVDRAHSLGLGVILDVVYNHLGPDGNYLPAFSRDYFSRKHVTDWGEAIHFYGENSGPVREYFIANAAYWIREFHMDGLRLDATQNIYDESPTHILADIVRACRRATGNRDVVLIAENESQHARLVRAPEKGGYGLDALWNDDFHHSATVALTGHNEAYYTDYLGSPQELISSSKYGFLFQGQWYKWQKKRRGTQAFDLHPAAMINFLQNHDQISNSGRGLRVHAITTPGRFRAMTAMLLLMPSTPMLFQGQEFGSSAPFLFFADHEEELAKSIRSGRSEFLSQWRSLATNQLLYDDPCDSRTFDRCKLDWAEREKNAAIVHLHADLLKLRRRQPVFARQNRDFDGAVLGPESFVLRFFDADPAAQRLLVVNLGRDLVLNPAPEPLLAPPDNFQWHVLWSSEDPRYGGSGTAALDSDLNWIIPGHAAVVLEPTAITEMKELES